MGVAATRFDSVVVGGGTAGCAVARRLAVGGHSTLVIEAGPDYGAARDGLWPRDLLDASTIPASHDWGYAGAGADGQPLAFERCRVIGGSSAHNGATQNVGWRGDYDVWAARGFPAWSGDALKPFFGGAIDSMRLRTYHDEEIQPFQRAFVAEASALGVPEKNDFLSLDGQTAVGYSPVSITTDGRRENAAFSYLDDVRDELTVLGGTQVVKIEIKNGRACGLLIEQSQKSGRTVHSRIEADRIVLCAGTYGSPELLLRSGVGPAEMLATAGVSAVHDLPGVGRNLQDHPAVALEFAGSRELARSLESFSHAFWLPDEQAIARIPSSLSGNAPYDLHVYPWTERDFRLDNGWRCVLPVALVAPRSRGRLSLRSSASRQVTHIDHGYLTDPADVTAIEDGIDWLMHLTREAGAEFASMIGERLNPTEGDLRQWIRRTHAHYWHPTGTCKMGRPDELGVVSERGAVHGIEGLFVADASIFPQIPRCTTALPTTVVGERVAAFLLEASS